MIGILAVSGPLVTESTRLPVVSGISKMTSLSFALRASTESFNQLVGARGTPSISSRKESFQNPKSDGPLLVKRMESFKENFPVFRLSTCAARIL